MSYSYSSGGDGSGAGTPGTALFGSYQDSVKIATPQTFADGVRTKITIDGLGPGGSTTYDPSGYWDTSTSKVTPDIEGAAFIIRLDLSLEQISAGSDEFIVDLDIGGSVGIIAQTTTSSTARNVVQRFSLSFPVFALGTFLANGGEFYFTAVGGAFEMSAAGVQLIRIPGP